MTTAARTTPAVLDRVARELPDHAAVVTSAKTLTYADLHTEVRRAAAALIALGIQPGDRVAIWSPNTWHWVVASLAIHHAGGVLVPLNTRYTASEAEDILARTAAPLLFASGEFLGSDKAAGVDREALPGLRHVIRIPIEADDGTWDEFVARGDDLGAVDERVAAVTTSPACATSARAHRPSDSCSSACPSADRRK